MNNKRIIIGVTIGIIAAILWSVVFINVLNSMAGIGIGIYVWVYLLVYLAVLFFQKKIKISDDTTSSLPTCPLREEKSFSQRDCEI